MKKILLLVIIIFLTGCSSDRTASDSNVIVFRNVTVIDGNGTDPLKEAVVVVEKEKIIYLGASKGYKIPKGATTYDMKGATLLPGFINAHVHSAYNSENLSAWARAGVTTVRDLSSRIPNPYQVRDELLKANNNARLIAAGPMLTTVNGYGALELTSLENAIETVQKLIDYNTDLIKIAYEDNLQGKRWSLLPTEQIDAIVMLAHENNLKVSVHVSHIKQLEQVVEAKVDDLAHMVVGGPVNDKILQRIVEEDIYWVPTLELWKGVSETYNNSYLEIAQFNLKRFYEAGGKIALGTDYDGYNTKFELGMPMTEILLMEEIGMTPMDIIVSATKNGAYVCGLEDEIGTIEVGKTADILIINGDPLRDLNHLLDVKMVLRNGEIIVNNTKK